MDGRNMLMNSKKQYAVFCYYNRPVVLQVGASTMGLKTALVQEGKPMALTSKALASTKTRYDNIVTDLLAVVYRCNKFHSTYITDN